MLAREDRGEGAGWFGRRPGDLTLQPRGRLVQLGIDARFVLGVVKAAAFFGTRGQGVGAIHLSMLKSVREFFL